MRCPRCETSVLDEREREGVTIDVCRSCRGIWLDRGELEKLIARERAWDDDVPLQRERERDSDDGRRSRDRDSDSGERRLPGGVRDARDDDRRHDKHRRKKSWLDTLGDIFD